MVNQPGMYTPVRDAVRTPRFWSLPYKFAAPNRQRVFCVDFSACNVFLRAGSAVNVDGRIDAYPKRTWDQIIAVSYGQPGWQRIFTTLRISVVVLPARTPAAVRMAKQIGWDVIYSDKDQTAFSRRTQGANLRKSLDI
jgi:hypothetical protein